MPDPCPLPDQAKKRTLDDRERLLYAPFSGVGGLIYDKDAVYIELGGSHSHSNRRSANNNNIYNDQTMTTMRSNNPLLNNLIATKNTVDTKLGSSKIQLFSNATPIESNAVEDDGDDDRYQNGQDESEEDDDEEEDEDEDDDDDECKFKIFLKIIKNMFFIFKI